MHSMHSLLSELMCILHVYRYYKIVGLRVNSLNPKDNSSVDAKRKIYVKGCQRNKAHFYAKIQCHYMVFSAPILTIYFIVLNICLLKKCNTIFHNKQVPTIWHENLTVIKFYDSPLDEKLMNLILWKPSFVLNVVVT